MTARYRLLTDANGVEGLWLFRTPNDPHPVEVLSAARLAHLGDDLVARWERVVADHHVLGRAA